MKKIKKVYDDYRENGEADAEFEISYWKIGIVLAVIVLIVITCNR